MTTLVDPRSAAPGAPGPLREAALALAVAAAGVGFVSALFAWPSLPAAIAVFALIAVVVLARVDRWHPYPSFGPANWVTTGRAGLNALLAGMLAVGDARLAWAATGVAAASLALDGLDGWLARRTARCSVFGARFDMEVDAVLILLLAFGAWSLGKAGPWVLASGLIRYGFVVAGWAWRPLEAELPPSIRRKAVCVLQTGALVLLVAPVVKPPVSVAIAAIALAALVWSFAADLVWLVRRAKGAAATA